MRASLLALFAVLVSAGCSSSSGNDLASDTGSGGSTSAGGADGTSAVAGGTGGTATGGAGGGSSAGGSGGSGGNGVPGDTAAACMAQAMAQCAKQDSCRNNLAQREYGSDDECIARMRQACEISHTAPMTGASAAATQTCAMLTTSATCNDFLAGDVCPQQMGTIAPPGACAFNGQCTTGYCAVPTNAPCGQCAPIPQAGDDCKLTGRCGPTTLQCDKATMKCVAPGTANAPCDTTTPCGPNLDCVGQKNMPGTCQPLVAMMGAPCDPTGTVGARCDLNAGLFCDKATMKCVAVQSATAGQSCGLDAKAGTYAVCTEKSMCVTPTGKSAGTCMAPAADGGMCDPTNGPPCESPAKCVVATMGMPGVCTIVDGTMCK